jgi:hypothetical protein
VLRLHFEKTPQSRIAYYHCPMTTAARAQPKAIESRRFYKISTNICALWPKRINTTKLFYLRQLHENNWFANTFIFNRSIAGSHDLQHHSKN